jgi:23S rRNA (guanosine2251-2'-O)-methyltransferase
METWIYGVRPVEELMRRRPEQVRELLVARQDHHLRSLEELAAKSRIPCRRCRPLEIEERTHTDSHQGLAARAPLPEYLDWDGLVARLRGLKAARLLVLDCIQDPQNLGALLRVAEGAGAAAVVIPRDRAAGLSPAVLAASAGAGEWVPVTRVVNLSRALESLKRESFWLAAADPEGDQDYRQAPYAAKSALVIGSEGTGIRPLVLRACDLRVRIPLQGRVASLNAAVAAGVILFEMAGQARGSASAG